MKCICICVGELKTRSCEEQRKSCECETQTELWNPYISIAAFLTERIKGPLLHHLLIHLDKHPPPRQGAHRIVLAAGRQRAVAAGGHLHTDNARDHGTVVGNVGVDEFDVDFAERRGHAMSAEPVEGRTIEHEVFDGLFEGGGI